jgi:hypothetical protein
METGMATRSQQLKAQNQRAAQERKAKKLSKRAAKQVVKRERPMERYPNPTSHNEAPRAAKNGLYELEPGQTNRPSRKSTRRSPTHIKTDSSLRLTAMARNASPRARSAQAGKPLR